MQLAAGRAGAVHAAASNGASRQTLGTTIDPAAEAQRLRANRVAGRPPTEGDTPTVITQRRQSALQGILSEVF